MEPVFFAKEFENKNFSNHIVFICDHASNYIPRKYRKLGISDSDLESHIAFDIGAKNLTRSKLGRAFSAIRDRDIAAEALGINLFKYKMYAFALSSFYGGIAGSILFIISGGIEPGTFNLLYSITFIAIVIIGGVGTVLGPLFGAFFFTMLPGIIQVILHAVGVADSGFFLNAGEIERIVFGFFIIFFLVFEPRGIWGIWFRIRNYFKAWPFSY